MIITNFNPAWLLMITSIIIPVIFQKRTQANLVYVIVSILILIYTVLLPTGEYIHGFSLLRHNLILLNVTKTSKIFAVVMVLMLTISNVYAMVDGKPLEISSAMFTAGSAVGLVFSGDIITLSLYFQLISVSSTLLVWSKGTVESRYSAKRYLILHLCSGTLMFLGVILFSQDHNSIALINISQYIYSGDYGAIFILIGILISVACPPFTKWLSQTYPTASFTGSVFLSGFMTTSGIYALMILFAGLHFLIYLGLFMIIYGIVYSLLFARQRKALSYLIINQVGFMLICTGLGSEVSQNAVCMLACANVIYVTLLYMSMGLVVRSSKDQTSLNMGVFRFMPFEFICTIIAGLSMSMFPLTSGFVAKSLLISALEELGIQWLYICILVGIAGVFASIVVRFVYQVIHAPLEKDLNTTKIPMNIKVSMGILALISILMGIFPHITYKILPYNVDSTHITYSFHSVIESLELLGFSGFIFVFILKSTNLFNVKEDKEILDFDSLWTKILLPIIGVFIILYENTYQYINRHIVRFAYKFVDTILTSLSKPTVSGSVWNPKITAVIPIAMILVMVVFFIFTHKI